MHLAILIRGPAPIGTVRVAIDWGVYGIPETFVVSADGRIALKQIGAVTEQALSEIILPLIARLRSVPIGGRS
jgi:cytochrome c biogenesis protein CcmG, thiol:disulfide interchange protein DsbE